MKQAGFRDGSGYFHLVGEKAKKQRSHAISVLAF